MKVAIFGGSFDPVHLEHVRFVRAAKKALSLDNVIVVPSFVAPHKLHGAFASGEERLEMCRVAFQNEPYAEVSDYELARDRTSYTYLTCEHFSRVYAGAELYLLVGADMLENFFFWKNPERILSLASLAACGRDGKDVGSLREKFRVRFGRDFLQIPFMGAEVSSTRLRVQIAFGKPALLDPGVSAYIAERGLYSHPAIAPALALEKPERREHSFRVALMAALRARSAGADERKALLAAALHDCGKYVPLTSPMLEGFSLPAGVPPPVAHQFTGAYLAERVFGVKDREVLDAIKYHTSGRENMSQLEKLVFLADLLEEERRFDGVEELRRLYWDDLDACLFYSLKQQTEYLRSVSDFVYPLTEEAYEWSKTLIKS